ncbi:MAG: hypothetical protein WB562_13815, partial [Candidatus Sulfotelmatobacter sp.]
LVMDQFPDTYWHTSVFRIYFLPAFTFAHLARWAAAIFLRPAADMMRLGFAAPFRVFEPLFAHRAFCARLIFLRAAADKVRRFRTRVLPVRLPRAANAAPRRFTSPSALACSFFN